MIEAKIADHSTRDVAGQTFIFPMSSAASAGQCGQVIIELAQAGGGR